MTSTSTDAPQKFPGFPRISVIVPAHNCAPYIEESLRSVLDQGIQDIEIVVVDDGSTDDSAQIAASLDSRVKVIRGEKLGPAGARNLAVRHSSGDYLAFIDADDVWLPGKLEAQVRFFTRNPEAKIVYAGHVFWHAQENGAFARPDAAPCMPDAGVVENMSGWIYPEMLLDSHIHIITAVCHRSVFDALDGFDGSFGKGSDYDFWLRASRLFAVYRLAGDGALYRINAGGISLRVTEACAQYEIVNRAIERYGYSGPDGRLGNEMAIRQRLALICFNHAYTHFWHGNPLVAGRFFRLARSLGRRDLKTLGYAALSELKSLVAGRHSRAGVV